MAQKTIQLNKQMADDIEEMYRNGSKIVEISNQLGVPSVYISVILATREVPLNARQRKPRVKLVSEQYSARLNESEEEFLNLIVSNPNINLFISDRDKTVVYERLGISQNKIMTFSEISSMHGVTKQRVQQIIVASFRRAKLAILRDQAKSRIYLNNKKTNNDNSQGIECLDLSVRAYNALYRNGIRTVSDLCEKTAKDILQIKNIGLNTYQEIELKLNNRGLQLQIA